MHRPWSYAIAHLGKDVENRRQQTHYRGLLAIHAGRLWSWDGAEFITRLTGCEFLPWDDDREPAQAKGIVAVTTLADCHHASQCLDDNTNCSPWAQDDDVWHLVLTGTVPLSEPIPCRGALGVWRLPDDIHAAVLAQTNKAA